MPTPKQLMDVIGIQTEIAKLGLDLGQVMSLVARKTLELIEADGAAIEFAEGDDMVYRATAGIAESYLGLRLSRRTSLSGLCIEEKRTLRCDDVEGDDRVDREACRKVGLQSMIVMPLRHDDAVVGVLKAMSGRAGKFGERDETLIGLLSEVVGASMYHAARLDRNDLFHKATHDSLTDLANRALFMDRLRNVVANRSRDGLQAGVLLIDMDGLKHLNDTFGHRVGDVAIKEVASRIRSASREADTVARLGGDEFAILLPHIEDAEVVSSAVARIDEAVSLPFAFEQRSHPLKVSIGSATFPADSEDHETLLDIADRRMYVRKQARYRDTGGRSLR